MQIEVGKFYRTRDGRKVGPVDRGEQWPRGPWNFKAGHEYFMDEGLSYGESCGRGTGGSVIAEWQDEPDDDIVEMSIAELTAAFAEALKVVGRRLADSSLKVGDEVVLSAPARITGFDKKNANIVLATGGSFAVPIAALEAA